MLKFGFGLFQMGGNGLLALSVFGMGFRVWGLGFGIEVLGGEGLGLWFGV